MLDNQDIPIRGVTLHIEGTSLTTLSDQQGQFTLQPAPVGHVLLLADGSTADRPGVWPTLEFDLTTVAGQDNTIGMPIYLLPLDIPNALFVDEVTGGVLTLPDLPGFSLTIAPGSATFPGGGKSGLVSVTLVHSDKIPMVPSFGQQPRFIVTIQPAGVLFDPVAPITIPNVEGLAPGEVTEMYSFDHDLGQFVSIGTGTVSDDGTTIESEPGVGILKGGWHCGGNPQSSGSSATLSLTVSPTKVVALVDDTFTITANGNPPLDGVYGWQITGGDTDAVEFTSISACPNQPSCQATLKAKKGGKTTVRVTFTCTTTGQSVSEDVEVIVLEADLDIEGVADADEESKGGIVGLNDDDDNTNSTPDKDESGTVAGENDLKKINLKVAPTNIMGTVKLEATAGGSKIKVWESATKGTQVTLPKTWTDPAQVPQMLWVEGFDTSGSVRDVGLKLSFTAEGKTADDKVKLTVVRIDLVIHKAKVIDTGESEIPEADELTKGAQTWVNLDNDDKDTKFDTGTTDTSVAGEDEMSKLKLKVFPKDVDMGVVKLEAFAGAADIKAWKMATKGTEYTFGSALNVPADFVVEGDALVKDLWGEGIEAHTAQQATKLRMTYDKTPGLKDEAALTFIGVKAMMWIGRGNGFTAGSTAHNSNTLDQDPAFGAGSNRLFAGGRAADVGTALDNADLEVELTVAPIENLDLYLKSYDVDDPSTETTRVDPNDGGAGGTYSGTAIGYTADEDNRGDVGGDKAGQFTGQDADDIVKVTYTPADTKKKAEFETAHHPGDNYKTVANGDKDFLKQLRNRDKDDGFRIVDPNVSGAAATREVRDPTMYSSQVLGVWRLLHVENDSMVAVPAAGAQRNQADGNITAIAGTAALAQRVTLSVSLAAGLPSGADGSPHLDSGGNGRFEGGTITIGGTPTANLDGNGANYARRNAGISIPFTVRAPAGPGLPADATGNTVGLAGTTFTLNVTGGALAAGHTGGTITVAGVVMNITAVNPGANTVTVAALANIPFVLIDDDTFVLPNNSNVGGLAAFNAASVLHVNDGGGGANNDQTVPFDLNGPNTSAGEVAIYNANRGSSGNEQNTFWVVYVASAYQDQETSDLDADREGGFTGSASPFNTTHNTNLVVGADGALIWREAEADTATNPFFVATNHQRNTAHEVGHQFGLGHGQVGLMHATLSDGNNLKPVSVNLVRSRVRSPGE